MKTWNHFSVRPFLVRVPKSICSCNVSSNTCSRSSCSRRKRRCCSGMASRSSSAKAATSRKPMKTFRPLKLPVANASKRLSICDTSDSPSPCADSATSSSISMPFLRLSLPLFSPPLLSSAGRVTATCCSAPLSLDLDSKPSSEAKRCTHLRRNAERLASYILVSPGCNASSSPRATLWKSCKLPTVTNRSGPSSCDRWPRPSSLAMQCTTLRCFSLRVHG
mmetsp:Transcript_120358/g.335797  ORF Transcript_120358/g.335797 Transcript_120358/m.335797 type:complete len:221 (+) Transcript_120358:117-779(+)